MAITKYTRMGAKWYVKIDGELVAGFVNEELADIFIEAIKNAAE